jgi:hypothetical protein
MVQRGEHLGFAGESRESIGVAGKGRWQDLDRDLAIELRIAGPVDSPIPPTPGSDSIRKTPSCDPTAATWSV